MFFQILHYVGENIMKYDSKTDEKNISNKIIRHLFRVIGSVIILFMVWVVIVYGQLFSPSLFWLNHPIYYSLEHNKPFLFKTLVYSGLDFNAPMKDLKGTCVGSPVEYAVKKGDKPLIDFLLDRDANPVGCKTVFHYAVHNRPMFEYLLEERAIDPNIGRPVLHYISRGCSDKFIANARLLISHGADVNKRYSEPDGYPPLYWAALAECPEMVKLLLDSGADPTMKYYGQTLSEHIEEGVASFNRRSSDGPYPSDLLQTIKDAEQQFDSSE